MQLVKTKDAKDIPDDEYFIIKSRCGTISCAMEC